MPTSEQCTVLIPELYTSKVIECGECSSQALVHYNSAHPLYGGHFPGKPVTPGVCLIQTGTELLQEAVGFPLRLCEARQIKFLQMHTPEDSLRFVLSWSENPPRLHGRITIFQDDCCLAKIDATFKRT